MNVEPIDPELRVLLQEIAANPRARLLRGRIPPPHRLPLTEIPWVRPTATGLTSAERQLLKVHREEVARILRQASEWTLQQDPLGAAQVSSWIAADRERSFVEMHDLRLRATRATVAGALLGASALDTLRSTVAFSSNRTPSGAELAAASLRFVPHDSAWVNVGRSLLLDGELAPARGVLTQVLRRRPRRRIERSAWGWLGAAHDLGGDPSSSARCYRRAATELGSPTPNSCLSWLVESVLAGQRESALEAAHLVDDFLPHVPPAVRSWTAGLEIRARLGAVRAESSAERLARELRDHCGPSAGCVLEALLRS